MAHASSASGHIIASRSAIVPPTISSPTGRSPPRKMRTGHVFRFKGST